MSPKLVLGNGVADGLTDVHEHGLRVHAAVHRIDRVEHVDEVVHPRLPLVHQVHAGEAEVSSNLLGVGTAAAEGLRLGPAGGDHVLVLHGELTAQEVLGVLRLLVQRGGKPRIQGVDPVHRVLGDGLIGLPHQVQIRRKIALVPGDGAARDVAISGVGFEHRAVIDAGPVELLAKRGRVGAGVGHGLVESLGRGVGTLVGGTGRDGRACHTPAHTYGSRYPSHDGLPSSKMLVCFMII